jgi:hypothetical protein
MSKYWQSEAFKKIEDEWNAKLKDEGFVDIEYSTRNGLEIKQPTVRSCRPGGKDFKPGGRAHGDGFRQYVETKHNYFMALEHCMEYAPPRNRTERFIMYYLAMGSKISEICNELKELGGPCHRQTVRFIIRKHEHLWGIKTWEKAKLNPTWRTTRIKL